MGSGKGFDFYRNNYTHDELWEMLSMGDSWSVEQAGSVWRTAKQDVNSARDNLDTAMSEVVDYWRGPASEEYQRRMEILRDYGDEAATSMERAEVTLIPKLSGHLSDAQQQARDQDLYPESTITSYEQWLEETKPDDLHYNEEKEKTQRPQLQQEYQDYVDQRHDEMARIVADLGDRYQEIGDEWREPPPPPPSDLPGNETYQPPTGGVFGSDGLNPAGGLNGGGLGNAPGADQNSNLAGADGIVGTDDDLEPVGGWSPGSYGDVDSGGVSGGGLAAGTYSTGFSGGAAAPIGGGGGGMTTGGAGLFGPAAGAGGGTTGRGGTTTSPARSGASSNARGTGGRGGPNTTGGRPGSSTRGLNGRNNMGGRGTGGRGGYADDDEEEEYSRETWLKEDDVNWGSNRTPDEEVDD